MNPIIELSFTVIFVSLAIVTSVLAGALVWSLISAMFTTDINENEEIDSDLK